MSEEPRAPLDPIEARLVGTLWRRGVRSALIGAGIGIAASVVLGLGLSLLFTLVSPAADDSFSVRDLVALAPAAIVPIVLGAMIGSSVSGMSVGRLLTATIGSGPEARRVRNLVLKGAAAQSPDDLERARRWAVVASVYLPYQALSLMLLYVGVAANQVTQLLSRPGDLGLWWFSLAMVVLLVVVAAVFLPLQLRNAKRARRYADLHAAGVQGSTTDAGGAPSTEQLRRPPAQQEGPVGRQRL